MTRFNHRCFYRLFTGVALCVLTIACQTADKSKGIEQILVNITGKESIEKSHAIVVIPNAGCNGCISNTEYYMTKNIADKSIIFIATGSSSRKILRMRFGVKILNQPNFYIDSLNTLQQEGAGLKNMYPAIIFIRNGRVEQIEEVSPENDGLKKLNEYLANKTTST